MTIKVLMVVPARSGSKGLAGKNVRLLGDAPLLAWTAQCIAAANVADSLAILSTDHLDYAEIGRGYGLTVPFTRPAALAGDAVGALEVAQHALRWFEETYAYLPELLMWLQPTSPFRPPAALCQALGLLEAHSADAVVACRSIYRDLTTLFRDDDGFLLPLDRHQPTQRSRDIRPLLTPNGAIYLCRSRQLLQQETFYPPKTLALPMETIESLDIDSAEDWAMAEALLAAGLSWRTLP